MSKAQAQARVSLERVVVTHGGKERAFSLEEFLALPLSQRIRCVLDRRARFYGSEGEIDRLVALDALRSAKSA
jgi:hypothetical protein